MMHPLLPVLEKLAPVDDPELIDGYQRYEALLETILTPEQLETYAALIQRTGVIRVLDELSADELAALTPQELVIVTSITADSTAALENRRVAALLSQRGQHNAAPDVGDPRATSARA